MIGVLLLLATVVLFTFYKWATVNNGYFKRRNLKYLKPSFLVGNTGGIFVQKYDAIEFSSLMYDTFPDES